jgi:hypothetical protein
VPTITDPQALNRCSYARNYPLKYVDPSGHAVLVAVLAAGGGVRLVAAAGTTASSMSAQSGDRYAAGVQVGERLRRWGEYFAERLGWAREGDHPVPADRYPGYAGGQEGVDDMLGALPAPPDGPEIWRDEESARHLDSVGANSGYIPDQGQPGIISLYPDAEVGEVVHERTHWEQDRDRGYVNQPVTGSAEWRREEAGARRAELEEVGHLYPEAERERIEREIRELEAGLEEQYGH